MYAEGVTCRDCHDPAQGEARRPGDVCLPGHAPRQVRRGRHTPSRRRRSAVGCPACHMPTRITWSSTSRHDHGFRVPRPDLLLRSERRTPATIAIAKTRAVGGERSGMDGPHRKGFQTLRPGLPCRLGRRRRRSDAADRARSGRERPWRRPRRRAGGASRVSSPRTLSTSRRAGLADPDPMVRVGALATLEAVAREELADRRASARRPRPRRPPQRRRSPRRRCRRRPARSRSRPPSTARRRSSWRRKNSTRTGRRRALHARRLLRRKRAPPKRGGGNTGRR